MPFELDEYDVSIINSLLKDGRKSFRQVSRETGITTPTVVARFQRLVNIGFIKSVSPIFDFNKTCSQTENAAISKGIELARYNHDTSRNKKKIKKGLEIKLNCEYCGNSIANKPQILKFANYERFFCCTECKSSYRRKYGGRIKAIEKRFTK